MGLLDKLFGRKKADVAPARFDIDELSRCLAMDANLLDGLRPQYRRFTVPKRNGTAREILSPANDLKQIQRLILRRVLKRLRAHEAVHGFERNRSIVTNARAHVGRAVVLRLDLKDFFTATPSQRVAQYFRTIGWSERCSQILTNICTHKGGLPQGAPTSPRLSNLVNLRLDARLNALAKKFAANYTRYADDLTFSFDDDSHERVNALIHFVKQIVADEGYTLHLHAKLKIQRRHERQRVTGLVVNQQVHLPRTTRHWLRAVEHHAATGKPVSITEQQLRGWRALVSMVQK